MVPEKNSKTRANRTLLIVILIAAFGVFIAIGAAIYLLLLKQPSSDDYAQATRQLEAVNSSYKKIIDTARVSVDQTRSTGRLSSTDGLKSAMGEYQKNVETLAESNVTLNDDVDRAMKAFEEDAMKQPVLIEGRTHVINASLLCQPMFNVEASKTITSSKVAEQSKQDSKACINAVKPLESSTIPEFKKFGQDLKNNAENRIEYLERFWGIFTIFGKNQDKVNEIEKEIRDVAQVIQPPDFETLSKQYDSDASFKSLKDQISVKSKESQ